MASGTDPTLCWIVIPGRQIAVSAHLFHQTGWGLEPESLEELHYFSPGKAMRNLCYYLMTGRVQKGQRQPPPGGDQWQDEVHQR